ncbi:PHP domain-containing protein [Mechercharimyces sp. CAU 1602]|uniref:PHP domain-containing protein n=1 Tax=Mechercharimyces sp. CAU 1602 TaxID=2973933 RepID=UPI0021633F21|nr:PHP domain-containing protein [Mechercharimyces sp. CAU 1602]MCS1351641.1 PHP domain-containing protein [Mechercharimyces sp. CAU 1602]
MKLNILNHLPLGSFDLHLHTTASDGHYSPTEVVKKAKEANLSTIAITDHDTLAGVEEAVEAGRVHGIKVIPAVEISTKWKNRNIDILGYNMKHPHLLHQRLAAYRDFRKKRAERILTKLTRLGMPLSLNDVKKYCSDDLIARPHIANAMVDKGYVSSIKIAFDHYLGDGKPAAVEKKVLSVVDGIQLIHETGGVAVLAHPIYIQSLSLVEELICEGFDGIEVWHRNHNHKDSKQFQKIAEKYRLLMTGGSDFHHDAHTIGTFLTL